ncbi:MAG: preprotein translocase subunit SecE, partial [Tepidisphaeraceae bacterium]
MTKQDDEKSMSDDEAEERDEESRSAPRSLDYRAPTAPTGGGFFHVYKSGQGYWTRMGTAGAAALLGLFTAEFMYSQAPARITYFQHHKTALLIIIGGMLAVYALIGFWLMNKPGNVDFLIATDSEMKKVNWTSRKDLIGSTKVVIFFMFMIAALLFA